MTVFASRRHRITIAAIPIGMIVGGELQRVGRMFLPPGAVKVFFTSGLSWQSASSTTINYLFGTATFGPIAVDVSIVAILGILLIVRMALATFE